MTMTMTMIMTKIITFIFLTYITGNNCKATDDDLKNEIEKSNCPSPSIPKVNGN